jgi:hypothetical protein
MVELFPPIEPYDNGLLDVGDGKPRLLRDLREP